MVKRKYMVIVNLAGITGPITLSRQNYELGGWWDRSGNYGWYIPDGPRKDDDCYEFVTDNKAEAKAFLLGIRVIRKRLLRYFE